MGGGGAGHRDGASGNNTFTSIIPKGEKKRGALQKSLLQLEGPREGDQNRKRYKSFNEPTCIGKKGEPTVLPTDRSVQATGGGLK